MALPKRPMDKTTAAVSWTAAGLGGYFAGRWYAGRAPHNVTVNCVVPGFIQKEPGTHAALDADGWKRVVAQIPLGRLGLPDDVAATVCHLLSADAAYITGQSIHVNGGLNL